MTRCQELVEWDGLQNRWKEISHVGSNPTLVLLHSAIVELVQHLVLVQDSYSSVGVRILLAEIPCSVVGKHETL